MRIGGLARWTKSARKFRNRAVFSFTANDGIAAYGRTRMVTVMEQVGPKRAYRVSELKAQGGPGRARAFKLIRDGKLLAHKDGHNPIIFAENLARYFASLPAIEPKAS